MTGRYPLQGGLVKYVLLFLVLGSYFIYYNINNGNWFMKAETSDKVLAGAPVAKDITEIPTCIPSEYQTDLNLPLGSETVNEIYRRQQRRMRDSRSEQVELQMGRSSADGKYTYYDRVSIGKSYIDLSLQYKTCLATQSSLDRLYPLLEMNDHWDGPLSTAVYVTGDEDYNLFRDYIYLLETCYPRMLDKMMFSLMFPKDQTPVNATYSKKRMSKLTCRDSDTIMEELLQSRADIARKEFEEHPYPQNHLRNLALHNCIAEYEYLVDVDIVPMKGTANALNSFLSMMDNCRKCAFVVPTYEIKEDAPMPRNKNQLLSLKEKGQARPYHEKVFPESQSATNYSKWEKGHKVYGDEIYVNHHLTSFNFFYEPFYISRYTTPHYDERFVGYGYTRSSQVFETNAAGYKFKVISPVFTVHRGMRDVHDWPEYRIQQNQENGKQFESFKQNIVYKYKLNEAQHLSINISISK